MTESEILAACQRAVPLGPWLERCRRALTNEASWGRRPFWIDAEFSAPFPVSEVFDALDGQPAPGLSEAEAWVRSRRAAATGAQVVRWECCAAENVKEAACAGEPWTPRWEAVEIDSPRVLDCTVGAATRLCVRPYVRPYRLDGWPLEFRVYYGPQGFEGCSSYYPQRPLDPDRRLVLAVRGCPFEHHARLNHLGPTIQDLAERACLFTAALSRECTDLVAGFTVDWLVSEKGELLFLEGGPPHVAAPAFGTPSAHPCCFAPGKVQGFAFARQPDALAH